MSDIRTKWLDPDFRRTPKTDHFCIMCGRDLKPGQPHRIVRYELDCYEAFHNEDWEKAAELIPTSRTAPVQDHCIVEDCLGMDCARKLGLEWSREPQ